MAIEIPAYRIVYKALPKAACTTVKAALGRIDPDFDMTGPTPDPSDEAFWHAQYQTRRFLHGKWRYYDASWWRFCVLRDPTKRLMSCYTDRVVDKRELHNCRRILRGKIKLPKNPDPDFFFQNLSAYVSASSTIKHHALPARLFVGGKVRLLYDDVYTIETLDRLAADLSQRTGKHVIFQRKNKSISSLTLDDLNAATIDALRPYLNAEYADFGQWYDNPLT